MPFVSRRQMRWMWANHPEMARRWADHTPDIESLPETADGDDAPAAKSANLLDHLDAATKTAAGLGDLFRAGRQLAAPVGRAVSRVTGVGQPPPIPLTAAPRSGHEALQQAMAARAATARPVASAPVVRPVPPAAPPAAPPAPVPAAGPTAGPPPGLRQSFPGGPFVAADPRAEFLPPTTYHPEDTLRQMFSDAHRRLSGVPFADRAIQPHELDSAWRAAFERARQAERSMTPVGGVAAPASAGRVQPTPAVPARPPAPAARPTSTPASPAEPSLLPPADTHGLGEYDHSRLLAAALQKFRGLPAGERPMSEAAFLKPWTDWLIRLKGQPATAAAPPKVGRDLLAALDAGIKTAGPEMALPAMARHAPAVGGFLLRQAPGAGSFLDRRLGVPPHRPVFGPAPAPVEPASAPPRPATQRSPAVPAPAGVPLVTGPAPAQVAGPR